MEHDLRPINILTLNYDWRNIFENNFKELKEKLNRDRLAPEFNRLFIISWSTKNYHKKTNGVETVHLKTFAGGWRFLYDLMSVFVAPVILWRKKFKPDVFVVRDFPMVPAGIFTKLFWRTKIVFFLGSMPADLAQTRKLSFLRWSHQRLSEIMARPLIDVFIANGTATKEYLIKMGVPGHDIKIMVEDVIKRDQKIITASKKGAIRKLYNIADDKKIILSVGRLEKEKGFDDLLTAFNSLARRDLVLIIAGDGVLKNELIAQVKNFRLENRVIFAGFVYREKIWDYYNDADAFMLLSRSEGNPTVFREAMYMGVPVIGSKIEAIREFVEESGSRGFMWSKEDGTGKFNEIINKCVDRPRDIVEMIERARRYIEENISGEFNINDFLDP